MKDYKAVQGPGAINMDAREGISDVAQKYADFINSQASQGWNYHSSSAIMVNKKGGCLRKDSAAEYKMMLFERDGADGGAPLAENEVPAPVSLESANIPGSVDTAAHGSAKKTVWIVLAVLLTILIGIAICGALGLFGSGRAVTASGRSSRETYSESDPVKPEEEKPAEPEEEKSAEPDKKDSEESDRKDPAETDTVTEIPTDPEGKTKYVAVSGGTLLYSVPADNGKVLDRIPDGTQVTAFSAGNGWAKVPYSGVEGWVREDELRDSKPGLTEIDGVVQPTERYEMGDHYIVHAGGGLRMRKGPDLSYDAVAVIPDGSAIEVFAHQGDWAFTEHSGKSGWVSTKYLEFEGGMAKPVIYLYPEEETEVSVRLHLRDGDFSCTYPDYQNGWNVIARPDGTLINKADGKEYSYLFWESRDDTAYDFSEGFVVKGSDTAAFLQKTLADMGLTPREYNEFIVYWLPLMQDNPYNLITFQQEAYTSAAVLDISPEPDSVLRVFMAYKPLEKPISITSPAVSAFDRHGFTVVEWGGTEVH